MKGATIDVSGCADVCPVLADAEGIDHVVSNLLDNAIKYGGPKICIETKSMNGNAELRVVDDGPGIPKNHRSRLFKAYERGGEHGPSCSPGSGLGLAIVADVVRAHGGHVFIEDRPQAGMCMLVSLPKEGVGEGLLR